MKTKNFLVVLLFFLFLSPVCTHCNSIATDVCDGAFGFCSGGVLTVAGVCGFLLTAHVVGPEDPNLYNIAAWIGYGASSIAVAGGLRLMCVSFKKVIGIKPKDENKINLDYFELVPIS